MFFLISQVWKKEGLFFCQKGTQSCTIFIYFCVFFCNLLNCLVFGTTRLLGQQFLYFLFMVFKLPVVTQFFYKCIHCYISCVVFHLVLDNDFSKESKRQLFVACLPQEINSKLNTVHFLYNSINSILCFQSST